MRIGTGPAAPLGCTVTEPVLWSTLTLLGGAFFSSSAVASSSSGFAYASPQAFFCSLPAASYCAIALLSIGSLGTVFSGSVTKSFSGLIGWLTPSHFWGLMIHACWPSPLWL